MKHGLALLLTACLVFSLPAEVFAAPPGGNPSMGSGNIPGGGPGSSDASSVTWTGATTITSAQTQEGQTYTSDSADENALLINTDENVTISNPTVIKSGGTSASDNYSFYGINSGVMVKGGTQTTITGGTVNTSAAGANGIFSYGANNGTTNAAGDGTTVDISDTVINTTGDGSGGIMTTYGGTTNAENLTVTTSGRSSAPIRTDRGGGWVNVNGGTYTSGGAGSPAIYSTADVKVSGATLVSGKSEGVCIEGTGSIALTDCNLTASNNALNGNATFYDTIMIYQSQSGDASQGTSSFTMTGGTLTSNNGHVFHVTNTNAVINLSGVTIKNNDDAGILLSVCDDGWSGGSNIASFNASGQTLSGAILVGSNSSLTLNMTDGTTYTGKINGEISNGKGTAVSDSVGTVDVTLGGTSKWTLTDDSYVTSFSGDAANVISNGHTLYVNGKALTGTTDSEAGSDVTDTNAADENTDENQQTNNNSSNEVSDTTDSKENTSNTSVTLPKAKISKLKAGRKKITVTWKKQNDVTGYQIRYSTKKNMRSAKTVTVNKASTIKKTIKKLKKGKKYYVQIRTYKKVSGKNYYGSWSAKKSVKVK